MRLSFSIGRSRVKLQSRGHGDDAGWCVILAAVSAAPPAVRRKELVDALDAQLQRVVAAIQAVLPEVASYNAPTAQDWAAVERLLSELRSLLAVSRIDANQVFAIHATLLKATLAPLATRIEQQIHGYLYPEALASVQQAHGEAVIHAHRD